MQRVAAWILAVTFAGFTMIGTFALLVWNMLPELFPSGAHALLGAAPLALTALALLIYQVARRPRPLELLQAVVVAAAFGCWAANQLLPDLPQALLLNDLAIALFVLDVCLLIVTRPPRQLSGSTSSADPAPPRWPPGA
jgi:hypothetical protein